MVCFTTHIFPGYFSPIENEIFGSINSVFLLDFVRFLYIKEWHPCLKVGVAGSHVHQPFSWL